MCKGSQLVFLGFLNELLKTWRIGQVEGHLRSSSRGELEVVDVNLSGRAQRRIARHARRARIPLVSRTLVVEDTRPGGLWHATTWGAKTFCGHGPGSLVVEKSAKPSNYSKTI